MAGKMGKKFNDLLGRSKSKRTGSPGPLAGSSSNADVDLSDSSDDSPERRIERAVWLFCESGSASHGGEEVLQLPVIVDAAESSPKAAAIAAQQIRRLMGREWATKPHVQYNAIMLIRILTDNPGPSFSKNFDKHFVSTIKEALRMCKDPSTQQILRETLDALEANKSFQEGMEALIAMWRKEKGHQASMPAIGGRGFAPPQQYQQGGAIGYGGPPLQRPQDAQRHQSRNRLPPAVELASRVEEARNTAKILLQLIQSTPAEELINNDLVREFADRCQSAQRSMQGYISADNPPPDDETMLTLIETNEQLSLASTRYQRSLLSARKDMGLSPSPNAETMQKGPTATATPISLPVTGAQPQRQANLQAPPRSPPGTNNNFSAFGDHNAEETYQAPPHPPPKKQSTGYASTTQSSGFSSPPPVDAQGFVPNPPATMLARLGSRDGTTPLLESPRSDSSDPFADPFFAEPVQNPAPLGYNTTSNVNGYATQDPSARSPTKTFAADAGPTYPTQQSNQSTSAPIPIDDEEEDNPYDSSPRITRHPQTFSSRTSPPASPPQLRPYHTNGPTPSYLNRQASAADHMTMHGAGGATTGALGPPTGGSLVEIDGHSEVGRTSEMEYPRTHPHLQLRPHPQAQVQGQGQGEPTMGILRSDTDRTATDDGGSAYGVTPVRSRT